MTQPEQDAPPTGDPQRQLEDAFVDEFLRSKGLDAQALRTLPEADVKRIMREASAYASARLAEVECRAHFVHEIHGKE